MCVLGVDFVVQELKPQQIQVPCGHDELDLVKCHLIHLLKGSGGVVFLEDDLHDVDAVDVVEEDGQVVGHRRDDLSQVGCFALLKDEHQQLFLDDVLLEGAQVCVDVLEEVSLFGVASRVDLPELDQCLLQLDGVEVVLDLLLHVFLRKDSVDEILVLIIGDLLKVHLHQYYSLIVLG